MSSRHLARSIVMQSLFEWDFNGCNDRSMDEILERDILEFAPGAGDFEFTKNYGWVRRGKGNKDRLFILTQSLRDELYALVCSAQCDWIFMGQNKSHISSMTIYRIIKMAARRAGIKKNVHPHTLRHSFATHLIENGYDVASVQSLLGHSSAETTMRYVHMASPKMINVQSPLDSLGD